MHKIFISHPYTDNPAENRIKANKICRGIVEEGNLPLSPLHLFSFLENDTAREEIMMVCKSLIDISDTVHVYGNSYGCLIEKEYALAMGKELKEIG